ncbi:hypothetical protein, partial [Vibrio sinaloensis]|uniref:hypothetical protein n=1 Tax=Photobacterium sp. (strain ATCC 43367) TaxID=379097 RepID=UPI000586D9B6
LGIPLSFVLAPLSIYFLSKIRSNFIFVSMLSFLFFCFILSIFGAYIDSTALLYWFQNAVPALWFFVGYIYTGKTQYEKVKLFNAFSLGLSISIVWVLSAFLIEFITLGFHGRISQNATLPGFYQTYNYLPSAISLSLALWLYFSLDTQEKTNKRIFFVIGGIFAIILTGSRGPLVSTILVLLLYGLYTKRVKSYFLIFIAVAIAVFISIKFIDDFSMLEKMDKQSHLII